MTHRRLAIIFACTNIIADRTTALFRAFSDRTRIRILRLLRDGEHCVGDLVEILGIPQAKTSRHLAYLRRAELVRAREDGLWVHYSLAPARDAFHRKLLECLAACLGDVPEVRADARRAARIRKRGGCCPNHEPPASSRGEKILRRGRGDPGRGRRGDGIAGPPRPRVPASDAGERSEAAP